MEEPPQPETVPFLQILSDGDTLMMAISAGVLLCLLILSALFSGAEIAFFSLDRKILEELTESDKGAGKMVTKLLDRPKRLLATILIGNNLVNVGFIIYSAYLVSVFIPSEDLYMQVLGFSIPVGWAVQVVGVTLLLLLFGEILPKTVAHQNAKKYSTTLAYPLHYIGVVLYPLSYVLIELTGFVDRRMSNYRKTISVDELSHALEITEVKTHKEKEEHKILEGIVKFGNTDVKQIMCPRTDVEAVDSTISYHQLLADIREAGYSRIPVYEGTFDNVLGVIYVKDLLGVSEEGDEFKWQKLIREPFFVPESKMIDDLLEEFKDKKIHLAVVVDEYGGTSGIITLEDIIEEIVGDISDEFDQDELVYSKLDDDNFVFEAKTHLKEFYRVMDIEGEEFEANKGESDTLAGFILELSGVIPKVNEKVKFREFQFTVEAADKRRIKRVKATIDRSYVDPKSDSRGGGNANLLIITLIGISSLLVGCTDDHTPKPKGYIRIDLPEHQYEPWSDDCAFEFEVPTYAKVMPDSSHNAEPCWMDVYFPKQKARVHLTYKPIKGNLIDFLEQARTLTNKHISMASGIEETLLFSPTKRVHGIAYKISGIGAASPYQFFVTDSLDHFLRGSLYFMTRPNNDSLQPVIEHIETDIEHLLNTFQWTDLES
ncbi:MAG: putative hemolysin [Granulosicoccus sp.]